MLSLKIFQDKKFISVKLIKNRNLELKFKKKSKKKKRKII